MRLGGSNPPLVASYFFARIKVLEITISNENRVTSMSEKVIIPVINKTSQKPKNQNIACTSCGSGGCHGGFGIKAGSEKEVVYRNIFLYLTMGIVMFVVAYVITRLLALFN